MAATEPSPMILKPIGVIRSPFKKSAGTPIQPRFSDEGEGMVEIFEEYVDALSDLDGFERIWLIYWFNRARPYRLKVIPYMDNVERGLFATRAPSRVNPIGISCVPLLSIRHNIIRVAELDILDGTPLLDIKPYDSRIDSFEECRCGWLEDVVFGEYKADERFEEE